MPPDESSSLEARVVELEARIRLLEEKLAASHPVVARPSLAEAPAKSADDLEARVGAYWLSRVGIVVFITGVAFLVIYKFGELGIALRIAAGYGLSAGLAALGHWVARRHRLFGEVLFGGGLAVAYFVTYALHFVPAVRVIESDYVAFALLGCAIAAVVLIAHRMQSETVAGIALFLGLHTGMLSDVTVFTLLATCLLAAGAVLFLVTHRWVVVPVSGLAAAYATHARWMLGGSDGGSHALSLSFLALYFSLFASAILVRPGGLRARVRVALCVGNATGLVALGWWELHTVEGAAATFLSAVAVVHLLLAAAAHARDREARELPEVDLGVALVTSALAGWMTFTGVPFGAALALVALAAAVAARVRRAPSLAWVGMLILAAALVRPPLLTPDPVLLALVAVAALVGGELQRPAAAHGWEMGLAGGYTGLVAIALLRAASVVAPDGVETLAWAFAASLLFSAGFIARARPYRLAGFAAFALAGARLLAVDLRRLGPDLRIATFLLLGALLLGVSFVYASRRSRTRSGS